jgi:SAM-dependent methyltransferase
MEPTERFTNRVSDYVAARPSYPPELLQALAADWGLRPETVVADVGSGTGILTRLFLAGGNLVVGVEPNAAMRVAAEEALAREPRFRSVAGSAEATTLPGASVDAIVAGQAFHWFDPAPTRAEWRRILRPGGWVALIWNERRAGGTAFAEGYERLLATYGTDYTAVRHRNIDPAAIAAFLGAPPRRYAFVNRQHLDREGLRARLRSSSYTPAPGHPSHAPMLAALDELFDAHQSDGYVTVEYDATMDVGALP